MKKFLMTLCFVACLAFAGAASAEVQTFGPDFSRFTVDVPEGWTAQPNDGGCQLISADGDSSISIQVHKSGGKSAMEIAQAIAAELPGEKQFEEEDGAVNIYYTIDGVKVATIVAVDGDQFLAITLAGPAGDTFIQILESLADVE